MVRATWLVMAVLLILAGCASHSYEVVRIPKRDADVYPTSHTRQGVTVAVDAISKKHRARRYFGVALPADGILPVNVTVSNHGDHAVRVGPADFLLHYYGEVVDPVPLETVSRVVETRYGVRDQETAEKIHEYIGQLNFKQRVVTPGATYQGVLFFDTGKPPKEEERFAKIRILRAFQASGYQLRFKVTDVETQTRLGFSPFTLHGLYQL